MDRKEAVSTVTRNLWAHLPGKFWVMDHEDRCVAVSKEFLDLIEEAQQEMMGKNIFSFFQDQARGRFVGGLNSFKYAIEKVKTTGKEERITIQTDGPTTHSTGGRQKFELLYRPVLSNKNELAYIIHQTKELFTPEKDKPLASTYQQQKAIPQVFFDSAKEAFCTIHVVLDEKDQPLDAHFIDANPAFENRMGKGSIAGKSMRHLLGDYEFWFDVLGKVALTGEFTRFEREVAFLGHQWFNIYAFRTGNAENKEVAVLFNDITAQKKSERDLVKAQHRLRRLIDIETVGVIFFEADGQIISANNAFLKMSGYTAEELAQGQLRWDTMTPPEYMAQSVNAIQEFIANGHTTPYEKEYIRKDGSRWWALFAAKSIDDEVGVEFIIDITERKKAEMAVFDSEARFRLATEAAQIYSWEMDASTYSFRFSENAVEILGLSQRSALPEDFKAKMRLVHPEDYDRVEKEFLRVLHDEDLFSLTYRVNISDDKYVWLEKHGKVIRNDDRHPVRIIGIAQNVTDRKETEEALRQSEEHLRMIMESATDYAIITLDENMVITNWNSGAERLLHFKEEEIVGRTGDVIFTMEDRENKEPEKELALAKKTGHARNERWHVRKDGSRFWGSGMSMPLQNRATGASGFLKIMRDTTEKRQMEESLKTAKEVAEKAAKDKEEFLAHMSHEIRTPLNAIVGLSNLLLQRSPREDQKENLQTLKFSSENLMNLINNILDFSKLEAGKIVFEETTFNFSALLDSIIQVHLFKAQEKAIQLQSRFDERLPAFVKGDQLRISQVLHNLISNAVKFTNKGKVTFEVTLREQNGELLTVDFSVSDTGIGISREKQHLIFEKFSQADISTMREYGGTGLGLTITKTLLELMNSNIQLESEPGRGARFFFSLPIKKASPDQITSVKEAETEEVVNLTDLKLLLVEDVEINRMVVSQFLQDWWGICPDEAINGQEALEKIKQNDYDLVLMDVRMPVMDGYQAAKVVRDLPDGKYLDLPIIALTADTKQDFSEEAHSSCFTDIVIKPFEPGDLKQKIIRYAPKGLSRFQHTSGFTVKHSKVEEFLHNDKADIILFYQKAIEHLDVFKQVFREAMTERDEKKLRDIHHKATILIKLMALENLEMMLQKSIRLIKERSGSDQISDVLDEGEGKFDQIAKELNAHINILREADKKDR